MVLWKRLNKERYLQSYEILAAEPGVARVIKKTNNKQKLIQLLKKTYISILQNLQISIKKF